LGWIFTTSNVGLVANFYLLGDNPARDNEGLSGKRPDQQGLVLPVQNEGKAVRRLMDNAYFKSWKNSN
jgi:hypothetical protein